MSARNNELLITSLVSASATALLCWQWWSASREPDMIPAESDVLLLPLPKSFAPKEMSTLTPTIQKKNVVSSEQSARAMYSNMRKRRSIFPKDFTSDPVPVRFIEEALSCANWAPTHGKTQPWRFIVCGKKSMEKLSAIRDDYFERTLEGEKLDAYRKKVIRKKKSLANVSFTIFIVVKSVTTSKGRRMPEWEEIAATSCAVQNFHLSLTARWENGVGGYWSSGGTDSYLKLSAEARDFLGAENGDGDVPNDIVLGAFYVGSCPPAKMNKYRSARSPISEKVTWLQ